MKSWLNKYFILFAGSLALMSCEKDEERLVVKMGESPVLTSSANTIILTEETATEDALTLNWSDADFGYPAAVSYTIEIDTAENNFAVPAIIQVGSATKKTYTVEEFNALLGKLKYEPEVAQDISIRVKATVNENVDPAYSEAISINVTPYSTFVEPSYLWVPGGYQGWTPDTAPTLISVEDNGIYKGLISWVGATDFGFKFTPEPDWDTDYGAGATAGSLAVKGSNLTAPGADTYELEVNLNDMTWSSKKHSWGVIGDATPGGWDNDTNMKYINAEGVWKATINLKVGKIKFRKNDAWDLNYGDNDTSNNLLDSGGADIPITTAGNYQIILDLENEDGSVKYTLTKL